MTWINRRSDANIWDNPETGMAITLLGSILKIHVPRDYAETPGDGGQSWVTDPRDFHNLVDAQAAAASLSRLGSFKVMVHGVGDEDGHYVSNGQRFATAADAEAAGAELFSRWLGMDGYRVEPSEDPVNCTVDAYGRSTFIAGAAR